VVAVVAVVAVIAAAVAAVAASLGHSTTPLVSARSVKPGKLPAETVKHDYALEYGSNTLEVHNGMKFPRVFITEDMVGHKLGEFSLTRTFRAHGEAHTKEASALT